MARKSKATLLSEQLLKISNSPFDIFSILAPTDELLQAIEKAESGDVSQTEKIVKLLFDESLAQMSEHAPKIEALPYWFLKAVGQGSTSSLEYLILSVCTLDYSPLLLSEPYSKNLLFMDKLNLPEETLYKANALYVIERVSVDFDAQFALRELKSLSNNQWAEALYVISALKRHNVEFDASELYRLEASLGIEGISTLPSFCGKDSPCSFKKPPAINKDSVQKQLRDIALKWQNENWRDFWLRIMYEYSVAYLSGDISSVAKTGYEISLSRLYSKKKNLHALALLKYIITSNTLSESDYSFIKEEIIRLEKKCKFDNISTDIDSDLDSVIKDAVYTSAREERLKHQEENKSGVAISHTKNRYLLASSLSGHIKRGKKHIWEITLCFPKASSTEKPPVFDKIQITEVRHDINRGGITLECAKGECQILCYSEILTKGSKHPFHIDFILDIAYVSARKCGNGEIVVKNIEDKENSFILKCNIVLT